MFQICFNMELLAIILLLVITLSSRIIYLLGKIWSRRKSFHNLPLVTSEPQRLMVVLGSGGHTKEILVLVKSIGAIYTPRSYIVAENDKFSTEKVTQLQQSLRDDNYVTLELPRSRQVHQSYFSSIFTSLKAIAYAFPIVIKGRPDLLVVNGPGTCIPVCLVAFLLRVLCIREVRIVYVESICRVTTLSLSGRILYYFVDSFIVQWPDLAQKFAMVKYIGRLL